MIETKFKQTEIGVIPCTWDVLNLNDQCSIKARIGWQGLTTEEYLSSGDYYLITGTDFDNGFIKWKTCHYVSKWRYEQDKNIQFKNGDVLITKDGTIGKVAYIDNAPGCGTLNSGVFVIRPLKENILPAFLQLVFKSVYFDNFINQITAGSTIVHLYQKDIVKFSFPMPSLDEQYAIAEAFNDIDKLLSSIDKMVEKKSNLKLAAMQQLLSGEKRLNGYEGQWIEVILGNMGYTYNGLSGKSAADFGHGKAKYVTFLNVLNNPIIDCSLFESVDVKDGERQNGVKKGDLLFNTSSETPEEVGICATLEENVERLYLNSFCFGYRLKSEYSPKFLAYFFRSKQGRDLMKMLAQGSTRYNLSKENLMKSSITIPQTKEEQDAIAAVLSDMDKEIAQLESRKSKYEAIKQGMMQQLLTGKIRLIN